MSGAKTGSTTGGVVDPTLFQRAAKQSQVAPVAANAPVTTVDPVAAIENDAPEASEFGAKPTHEALQPGGGQAVSQSASATALWDQQTITKANPPLETKGYYKLGQEGLEAKLADVEKKQVECAGRIGGRAAELDRRWKYMELGKKTDALKHYLGSSTNLTPELRTEIEGAIDTSEKAQERLAELRAKVKKLRPNPETGKNGTPEKRAELARDLFAARRERSQAVEHATAAVDAVGLKIERLTLTESHIDPSGGAKSAFGSMVALVGHMFELMFMRQVLLGVLQMVIDQMSRTIRENNENSRREVAEAQWRNRDELVKTMMREVPRMIAGRKSERIETKVKQNRLSDKKGKKTLEKVETRAADKRLTEKQVSEKKLEVPKLNLGKI